MKMNDDMLRDYLGGLETERLTLEPLVESDAKPWQSYMQSPECTQFMYLDLAQGPEALSDTWVSSQLDRYTGGKGGLLKLLRKEDGAFLGQAGLLAQVVDAEEEWEIGYHLLHDFWGEGYATEAAIALREFAKDHDIAPRIISIIKVENHRSKSVALRNGMSVWKRTRFKGLEVDIFRKDLKHQLK